MTDTIIQKSMDTLSTCPLFAGLKTMEIHSLLAREGCRLVHYPAGSVIPSQRGMLILLSGSVLIEKQTGDGRYMRLREAWPPQAINVSALARGEEEPLSRLSAPEGCRAVELSPEWAAQVIAQGGQFTVNLTRFLLDRVVFLNHRITALSGHSAGSRLELYLQENCVVRDGVRQVRLPCSLSEFAELLCVGRASLYRTLDAMEAQGRIRRKGRVIQLLD